MTEVMNTSSNVTPTTAQFLLNVREPKQQFLHGGFLLHNISVWIYLAIMILGLTTNPMILIVPMEEILW